MLLVQLVLPAAAAAAQQRVVDVPGLGAHSCNALTDGTTEALGLRYAASAAGANRFRPPQPPTRPPAGGGVTDATSLGAVCMQNLMGAQLPMGEDCLFLNVWAPPGAEKLPVAFWVHGGGFTQGSGDLYNGTALSRNGLVVVTINCECLRVSADNGPWPGYPLLSECRCQPCARPSSPV